MRKYKYMMAQFTFYDRTGIRKLLETQAEKGWLLDKVTNYAWRFRRIEPAKVHYAVTYFPKASAYDPGPSERQRELQEFCAHSGWILAGSSAQLQVFYNFSENPLPIETEPQIELENIHRSAKRNYLPAYGMLLILALVQIGLQIGQMISFPLTYLSQDTVIFNWLCEIILFTMCTLEISGYFHWYRRAKAAAANGEFVETRGFRKVQLLLLWVIILALILLFFTMNPRMAAVMGITLVMLFAVIFGIMAIHSGMKKRGVPTGTNRTVTLILTFVLTIAITAAIFPVTGKIMNLPVWEENREVRQYEWNGHYFDIYNDPIPLRVEDLVDVNCPDYSCSLREQSSPLLKKEDCSQTVWVSSEHPEMSYTIYTTKIPAIYDLVVRETTTPEAYPMGAYENGELYYEEYISEDASQWNADAVYRRYAGGDAYFNFVLCYENRVIVFSPDWELTGEQMKIVGEILGKQNEQKFENLENSSCIFYAGVLY